MNDSLTKKDIINNFHEYKNPLLIYGNPGCGKSYLANELLKDTILLRIDLNLLRGIQNSKEYILDRLKKRNVTLMFHNKNEQRGLLIDDIHVFYKYDKSGYKSLLEFIKDKQYYKSKIIYIISLLLIMGLKEFIRNSIITMIHNFKKKV